ncbi:HAD family hydrolase [Kitasatospora azatica]|uniref:HAD family hydrolase n=1 Tax=Kitasatospora azatica TaxID=58347 RepID=UPI0005661797|nr:HAD hydrolase family protein [Kitasatospora azatica]
MSDAPALTGPDANRDPGPRYPAADGPADRPDADQRDAEQVVDLQADLGQLTDRLRAALDAGHWLDSYLLAAGALQVAEDRLQGVSWPPRRLADHLGRHTEAPATRAALGLARGGLDLATAAALTVPGRRGLRNWCAATGTLTDALAERVLDGLRNLGDSATAPANSPATASGPRPDGPAPLPGRGRVGRGRAPTAGLLRPPCCFCSFDQHPADVLALVERFAAAHPDRDRPLLVLGVRTSGSYLGPLAAAALRRLGYRSVRSGTTRPGLPLLPGRAAEVRRIRDRGGAVLVLDDPPVTGGSLAAVCARAERTGFATEAVLPLFATFDADGAVPPVLLRYPCQILPGSDWRAGAQLRPAALARLLPALLPPGRRLTGITAAEPGPVSRARHLAVPLTARLEDPAAGPLELPLLAEWAGIGYLGEHAALLAAALPGLVPRVYGFADGVLLRERLPDEQPATPPTPVTPPLPAPPSAPAAPPEPATPPLPATPRTARPSTVTPAEVARYVAARRHRLACPADRSLELAGRQPVWEIAARLLAPVFGRLDLALRPTLLHPLVRALLAADRPCVVDGRTTPQRWVAAADGSHRKTDFAEGAFSHRDLASYDAAFDLAGAAVLAPDAASEDALLTAFTELTGATVPAARWCLLKLVHAWDVERMAALGVEPAVPPEQLRRLNARIVQRFLAEVYLADLDLEPAGPWCVLDIDGVLEADILGFPSSAPQGMLALRALRAHGYRTLLATGRSLPELRDRCAVYRLAGGVAEYGAVCFDAVRDRVELRLPAGWSESQPDQLRQHRLRQDGLRQRLAELPEVWVDPLSEWCVRASTGSGRHRTALAPQTVARLLTDPELDDRYTVVPGDAQSDFVPRGTDKRDGVQALLRLLGAGEAVPRLAVGDGPADLALLRWAELGLAPGNAAPELRAAGVPVLRPRYQAGLAAAVGRLIGHPPGGCPFCKPLFQPPETEALLALLAVPEAGRPGAPARIARLARVTAQVSARATAAARTRRRSTGSPRARAAEGRPPR